MILLRTITCKDSFLEKQNISYNLTIKTKTNYPIEFNCLDQKSKQVKEVSQSRNGSPLSQNTGTRANDQCYHNSNALRHRHLFFFSTTNHLFKCYSCFQPTMSIIPKPPEFSVVFQSNHQLIYQNNLQPLNKCLFVPPK